MGLTMVASLVGSDGVCWSLVCSGRCGGFWFILVDSGWFW
jgi:hypothetical protein